MHLVLSTKIWRNSSILIRILILKETRKKICKIINSLNINNNNFQINKKSSRTSGGDSGKRVNLYNLNNIKKKFKCLYTNATSLANKLSYMETLLAMEEPDAVFITETWFKENSCPSFQNYNLYRKDRLGLRSGSGVCMYLKKL